jgi:hypothetical protein
MPTWLFPAGIFWPVAALFLGGMMELRGGTGFRQVLGLLICFGEFLLAWWLLGKLATPLGPIMGVVVPLLLASAVTPLLLVVGYRVVGIRLERAAAH